MSDWFLSGLSWLLSSVVGGLITYLFMKHRDESTERKKIRNELVATSQLVCFYLAMQQSELGGLLKNIEYRQSQLNNIKANETRSRDSIVAVLQDFSLYQQLNINIEKISEVILFSGNNERGIVEVLQSIFISNKKYFKILSTLERFNEVKRLREKEAADVNVIRANLLSFSEINFPEYIKEIEQNFEFISKSLESFKATMKDKFNIIINLSVGPVVQLN